MRRKATDLSGFTDDERKVFFEGYSNGYATGYANGYSYSYAEGVEDERRRFAKLLVALQARLCAEGKEATLYRAVADPDYAEALAKIYFPQGIPGLKSKKKW